ncbi:toprim domain-containing protein [Massilia oculi]|uniref:DNA primase n=1 Tax=Massilia oculi TaxID=945844 RepID=A0A2S2DK42_9BURK|nr:toprim domain-containing protein [Massilia oculi]AWL05732.1 DNA primase [Massilia oculi]
MARIPAEEIERLKRDISVRQLAEAHGVELAGKGANLIGRCPFHADRTPSLVITPEKNLWHCLGACQAGGGPIDWVMRAHGVSFRHAVELLRADSALAAGVGVPVKLPAPVAPSASDGELLNQVVGFYHQALLESPEALAYLGKRGLGDPELIALFRLGYANRTLGYRLPAKNVKAGAEIKSRLQRIGILRASGHEHFNGSIVIPVIDSDGNVTEVYGRKLRDDLRAGTPLHLYLPGAHKGVWNAAALAQFEEIILCEALIDALTFWQAGFHNVTASYGVGGFTPDHLAAFQLHGVKRVLIAYDHDEAGDKAAAALAEQLTAAGIECYRIEFPKGMDANEYALKVTPAAKSLGILIRKAAWMGKGAAPQAPGPHVEEVECLTAATMSSLAASPAVAPVTETAAEVKDDEVVFTFAERRYRVRGLPKNLSPETLKINLLASNGEAFHVDTLDLYSAKGRAHYLQQAAKELGVREDVVKHDLGRILLKLEALQDERIRAATKPEPAVPAMSAAERDAALAMLRGPGLLDRIVADFDACGLVGERTNKLVGYLAAVSRKLDRPLAIVVQSSSAAGKSSLMDAVLAMIPQEERIKYSAMTGQSLFYMGETNLQHKILAIVEEEGASRASYALKLLQSEGELTIASTGKDANSGNLITQEYRVTGPVMIFLATTAIEIDEELMNRCIVLTVDEGRAQTEAIHSLQRQRRTLAGLLAKQGKEAVLTVHQNAQRLLRPLAVVNPYADQLTFLSDKTRTRRDHEKYLTLIDTIALLHQYQREVKNAHGPGGAALEYIEATLDDIEQANRLTHEVLGRSLDELPPQTRRLLTLVAGMVDACAAALELPRKEIRFSRKDVRAATGWGDTQLKIHLGRLAELEYLLVHRAERGQGYVYELLYDGDGSRAPHLFGLLDAAALGGYDGARSGQKTSRSASGRAEVGAVSAPGRGVLLPGKPVAARVAAQNAPITAAATHPGVNGHAPVVTVTAGEA